MADEKRAERETPSASVGGKIDLDAIRQLLMLMGEHDVAELEIEQEDLVVRLRKASAAPAVAPAPVLPVAPVAVAPAVPAAPAPKEETLPAIKSPMVGTYYVASSPEAPPYVKVGDHVNEDTVVCVIEAMKVFNEIRAEMSGMIETILVKNQQAVEFGQPLFIVRPG